MEIGLFKLLGARAGFLFQNDGAFERFDGGIIGRMLLTVEWTGEMGWIDLLVFWAAESSWRGGEKKEIENQQLYQ
jgi:hypothetical protein